MYAMERQNAIRRMLTDTGRIAVADLAAQFQVTTETVRRDLKELADAGALVRVHGGAVSAETARLDEPDILERSARHSASKRAIAQCALAALPSGASPTVFIDAGSTTQRLADLIPSRPASEGAPPLNVVTHAIPIAHRLMLTPGVSLTMIGGHVRTQTGAAVGPDTVRVIEGMRPDVAFLGVNGVSAAFGLSTPDPVEASVKRAIVQSARRVVVLADSEKFGRELLVSFASLEQVRVLVTDIAPSPTLSDALAAAGTEVWVA